MRSPQPLACMAPSPWGGGCVVLYQLHCNSNKIKLWVGGGGRDLLEGGGGMKCGGRGLLAGTPLLPGSPCGPRRRQAKNV